MAQRAEGEREVTDPEGGAAGASALREYERRRSRREVYVIDAKNVTGKVRVAKPLFGSAKLLINGRDRTKLIDGLDRQVAAVTEAIAATDPPRDVTVHGALCSIKADLPLIGTQRMRGHRPLYRRALTKRLKATGPLQDADIKVVADHLAASFPPA